MTRAALLCLAAACGKDGGGGGGNGNNNNTDETPPVAPSQLQATASLDDDVVDVQWSNPDAVAVLLARFPAAAPATQPLDGVAYGVGNALGTGTVIYTGSGSSTSDTPDTCARWSYRLWWRDGATWSTPLVDGTLDPSEPLPLGDLAITVRYNGVGNPVSVDLTWTNPTDPARDHVVLLRKGGAAPTSVTDGDVLFSGTGSAYSDQDPVVLAGGAFGWAVYACNRCGECDGSGLAGTRTVGPPDLTPPDPVSNAQFVADDSTVAIAWSNPAELAGVRLLRSDSAAVTDPADALAVVVCDPCVSPVDDNAVVNGTTYYYSLFTYDAALNFSGAVQGSATPVPDTTAPAEVFGFGITPDDAQLTLRWANPTDPDFFATRILRKGTNDIGAHTDATATVVCDPCASPLIQTPLTNGTTYYYKAFTVDTRGNWSAGVAQSGVPNPPPITEVLAPGVSSSFGTAVTIAADSGGTVLMAVGASGEGGAGAVHVYQRTGVDTWVLFDTLTGEAAGDAFGGAVALAGDNTNGFYLAVGAQDADQGSEANAGAVYVYYLPSTAGSWDAGFKISPSTPVAFARFGAAVDISLDAGGDSVIVGAPRLDHPTLGDDFGGAWVYRRLTGNTWGDEVALSAPDQSADDEFGTCVGVSGGYAVVGSWGNDGGLGYAPVQNAGAVYAFERTAPQTWSSGSGVRKLMAPSFSLVINPPDAVGKDAQFGRACAIHGDFIVGGAWQWGTNNTGGAFVFQRTGGAVANTWDAGVQLPDGMLADFAYFGWSVAITADGAGTGLRVVVGAFERDVPGFTGVGSAHLYDWLGAGNSWGNEVIALPPNYGGNERMGQAVGVSGDFAVFGSNTNDTVYAWEFP